MKRFELMWRNQAQGGFSLFHAGADIRAIHENHQSYLYFDIQESSSKAKKKELACWLLKISDRHRDTPQDHTIFRSGSTTGRNSKTKYSRMKAHVHRIKTAEKRAELHERVRSLNTNQMAVFEEIIGSLNRRRNEDTTSKNGKICFLQGRAGTRKTFMLQLLQTCVEFNCHIVLISAKNVIPAFLYGREAASKHCGGEDGCDQGAQ